MINHYMQLRDFDFLFTIYFAWLSTTTATTQALPECLTVKKEKSKEFDADSPSTCPSRCHSNVFSCYLFVSTFKYSTVVIDLLCILFLFLYLPSFFLSRRPNLLSITKPTGTHPVPAKGPENSSKTMLSPRRLSET